MAVLAHQALRRASALTVINFEVVLHGLCVTSGFFSLSRIKQNFQSLTKKKKKNIKLAAQQSSKTFASLLNIAAQ